MHMISVVDDTQRCVVMATLVQDDIGWVKRVKKAVESWKKVLFD